MLTIHARVHSFKIIGSFKIFRSANCISRQSCLSIELFKIFLYYPYDNQRDNDCVREWFCHWYGVATDVFVCIFYISVINSNIPFRLTPWPFQFVFRFYKAIHGWEIQLKRNNKLFIEFANTIPVSIIQNWALRIECTLNFTTVLNNSHIICAKYMVSQCEMYWLSKSCQFCSLNVKLLIKLIKLDRD